jgi:hypothetical protein
LCTEQDLGLNVEPTRGYIATRSVEMPYEVDVCYPKDTSARMFPDLAHRDSVGYHALTQISGRLFQKPVSVTFQPASLISLRNTFAASFRGTSMLPSKM